MGKTAAMVARIGNSATTHELRGEFRYDRSDNRTMCHRTGITGVDSMQSGKELPVTCKACQEAGPKWIVYLHTDGEAGFGLTHVENLTMALIVLANWGLNKGTDNVSARLYPFTPENWADAEEFRTAGCPFDYPSKQIECGPRGAFRFVEV